MELAAGHVRSMMHSVSGQAPSSNGVTQEGWRKALVLYTAAHGKAPGEEMPLLERARLYARLRLW